MNPISILLREDLADLTPAEDAALASELSKAYHKDEASATSRDVQRIVEKVRLRLSALDAQMPPDESTPVSKP